MKILFRSIAAILAAVSVVLMVSLPAMSKVDIGSVGLFSEGDLFGWRQKLFSDKTSYEIVHQYGERHLSASSDMSASAFYKKIKVDLNLTPYLNWSWKVGKPLDLLNEKTQAGDDYAARVYVIVKRGLAPWKANALNYVWSSSPRLNDAWPNAFTQKAIMIPLRTRLETGNQWRSEKVNVKKDFKKHFGLEIDEINGVAIMTDTDNSGSRITAAYGDLYFSSH